MDFDELKVIWDTQEEQPLYAIDEVVLNRVLSKKRRKLARLIFWQELQTYVAAAFSVGVIVLIICLDYFGVSWKTGHQVELSRWDALALIVSAALWLRFACHIFNGRQKQKRLERKSAPTLLDRIDSDISQVEFQIRVREQILWHYLSVYAGVWLFLLVIIHITGQSVWLMAPLIAMCVVALVIETRAQRRMVDREMHPWKRELHALRAKLIDPKS
jgi:hypothetical protein